MDSLAYWISVLGKILIATFSHWRRKVLLGLVITMIALIVQYGLHLRSLTDTEKFGLSFIVASVVVIIGSFFKHLFLVPPALYREQQLTITHNTEEEIGRASCRERV